MTGQLDYKRIGLKCGIEIHQQLNTRKLFCRCPSILRDDAPDIIVKRKLRAVMGETGEIDVAARAEMEKQKYFVYQAYSDTTCLVELDEEPPHLMDKEALDAVLQTSLLLKAKPVDEVQIMRKTVVNGSNTTGFQRTALVARNGLIETHHGKVTIPTISIEEDSAKDIEKCADHVVYRLDRLGIPLVEIGTGPDIVSPEQCKEVAAYIGMALRSTGKVKRGLGTIRQDVNVSVAGGARIEIKGAQDLKMLPTLVEYEAMRQLGLIKLKEEMLQKNIKLDGKKSFSSLKDASSILKNTACKFVKKALDSKQVAFAVKLEGFSGLLGRELQPGKRVGTELSDYAKVRAGIGGIIHSGEKLEKYNLSEDELVRIRSSLSMKDGDAFVIVVSEKERAERALEEVCRRASLCSEGVLREVRKANDDGTTSFMRPMPGAARLYPETDTLPMRTDISRISVPELLTQKAERFVKEHGLGADLANMLVKSEEFDLIEEFVREFRNIKPAFIAETVLSTPKNVKKKLGKECSPTELQLRELFERLDSGNIAKESVFDIFSDIANGSFDLLKYELMSDKQLESEIKSIVYENKGLPFNALIGKAMERLRGKADGKKIVDVLKKFSS